MGWMIGQSNDRRFEEIFQNHIANTVLCAQVLADLFSNINAGTRYVERISEHEHTADAMIKSAHQLLDATYIVKKIDKADIVALLGALDDIIDFMKNAAKRVEAYHITESRKEASAFTEVIIRITKEVELLISVISRPQLDAMQKAVGKIKDFEEQGDALLVEALGRLSSEEPDAKRFVQWKDIFENLAFVTDACQDVADVVASIVRKIA